MAENSIQKEIDEYWAKEADRRAMELENDAIKPIPGKEVFETIRKKYKK